MDFFKNNKLAFSINLMPDSLGGFDFITNIAKEVFDDNDSEIQKLNEEQKILKRTKQEYLREVGNIIFVDKNACHFYFPYFLLLPDNKSIFSETFEMLIKFGNGFKLIPFRYFSSLNKPLQFHIIQRRWWILKLFNQEEFETEIHPCERDEFEKQLYSEACQKEYVELYAEHNSYYVSYEEETRVYVMANTLNNEPLMFIIAEL
jgi:hypothetical protein